MNRPKKCPHCGRPIIEIRFTVNLPTNYYRCTFCGYTAADEEGAKHETRRVSEDRPQ